MLRICIQALFSSLMYIVIPQYNWGLVLDLPLTPETRNTQGPCISCHHRYALNYLCIMYTTQYEMRTKANTCTTVQEIVICFSSLNLFSTDTVLFAVCSQVFKRPLFFITRQVINTKVHTF